MSTAVVNESQVAAAIHKDPALDAQNQHRHGHIHHGPHAESRTSSSEPAYVRGISSDDRHVPTQRSRAGDVELGMKEKAELPGAAGDPMSGETGSLASEFKEPGKAGRFYRKYKIFVHSFLFLLVTG